MLSIRHILKTYGLTTVLHDVSFTLNAGERAALVGPNGVGKSTLLKIITGELPPDDGQVQLAPGARLGYLAQVMPAHDGQTLGDLIARARSHLQALEAQMRTLESAMTAQTGTALAATLAEYGEVSAAFERAGGYDGDHAIEAVLGGLGVGHLPRDRRWETLSGGEKARVGLALLLLEAADVLLLDEPTNHLDAASLDWLEATLAATRGALLIVSHDRHFINRTVNAIIEIDEHTRAARRYTGDYDAFVAVKAAERARWQADYAAQQDEIARLTLEIKETGRRNNNYRAHSDGDKFIRNAKIAQHDHTVSKRVRLAEERLKRIEADPVPRPPAPLRFQPRFDPAALEGRLPLVVSGVSKSYGGRRVLDEVHFTLDRGARIVLTGPNGAGKTTLLRILAGVEQADAGGFRFNPAVQLGYLDQEGLGLDERLTVFDAYAHGQALPEQALKTALLGSGLFRYAEFARRVGELSLGQRRKLQLARLIGLGANLLLLDEPTNYISFDVLEELEAALVAFPGPVLAVSHDRRFIQKFAQAPGAEVWALAAGQLGMASLAPGAPG